MKKFAVLGLALAGLAAPALAQPAPSYRIVQRIPGPDGGWDIATFDPDRKRVYVAHGDSLLAVDARAGTAAKLAPASRSHEVLPLPGGHEVLESDGGTNTARLLNAETGAVLATIPTGKNPDAEAYDPVTRRAFVMNGGSGDITVIDPKARKVVGTVQIGGKLEFGATDGRGQMFVNVEDKGEIAIIDTRDLKLIGRHKLEGCEEPSGLAYDRPSNLLIAACGNGVAKAIPVSTDAAGFTLRIGKGPDTVMVDEKRRVALIPCGRDGLLEVISLADPARPAVVAHVPTQKSARTGAVDPDTGRVYLPAATYGPPPAAGGRPSMQPGSFQVLVLEPVATR